MIGHSATDSGYGDLEVGAKWHLFDNQGARPSFALIPSVILPTGAEEVFTAVDPVYQLNTMSEWSWRTAGARGRAGRLSERSVRETAATARGRSPLSLGRSLPSPAWSAYGEAAYVTTNLDGAERLSFLGAGVKYLVRTTSSST